ncbi:MAG: ABC transporter substrate-binding protein [Defluviitaleaceae bacterium]|nr:ABC transporter substrate-binding protein [Defluviitaleaceae bacterium]
MKCIAVCAAAATLVLGGCGSAPAVERLGVANAEITYVSSFALDDPFARVLAGAIAEYEATSGNRVNVIWNGEESAEEVLMRHESGLRVDVWDGDIQMQLAANAGLMLDLAQFADRPQPLFGGRSLAGVANPFLINFALEMSERFGGEYAYGQMLAVPFAPYNVAFVYNQAYFAAAGITRTPRTWAEFRASSQRLYDRGFVPISGQMRPHLAYGYYLARLMGTDWVERLMNDTDMWKDPAVFRMADSFDRMSREGIIGRNEGRAYAGPHAASDDRIAMWLMRTSDIRGLVEQHGAGTGFGAFNFPAPEADGRFAEELPAGQVSAMYGAHGFFVSADTYYAEYAFDMISTILSPNFDQQLSAETFGVPFAADIPWPAEIRGIEPAFAQIGAWIPYGGGTKANRHTRERADEQFRRLLQARAPARYFIIAMSEAPPYDFPAE